MKRALLAIFLIFTPVTLSSCVVWDAITAGTEQATEQETLDRLLILEAAYQSALVSLEAAVDSGALTGDSARSALDAEEAAYAAVTALREAYADGRLSVAGDFGEARRLLGELLTIIRGTDDAS